jgi:hypothetical protein
VAGFIIGLFALWMVVAFRNYCHKKANLAFEARDDTTGHKWLNRGFTTLWVAAIFFMGVAAFYRF